jgi:hypothetical protein
MSDIRQYTTSPSSVDSLENGQHSTQTRLLRGTASPTRASLPEIGWVDITQLQVDHSYQHPPYPGAVESLRKEFNPAWSGFILVNIREDGTRWIIDGQTRRAVHEQLRLRWIRAEILKGLTDIQEAEIYLLKCINTQRVPVDFFTAELKANRPTAVLLDKILAQRKLAVKSFATEYQHRQADGVITCIATLRRLLRADSEGFYLGSALDLIIETWGYHKSALASTFIQPMHRLLMLHDEDIDKKSFVSKLSGYAIAELQEMARNLRSASTPSPTLGAALQRKIIELYNIGRQTGRIALGA